MKCKVIVGYEWKDELRQYCNHTASVAIEMVPDGEIDVAKVAELITPLRQLCQAKVYEAMQQGREDLGFERAQDDQQPDPVRERLNAPPPSNPRQQRPEPNRPYTQDEYDRDRQYDKPRQQEPRREYRNGNGNGNGYNGGGQQRQGGGGNGNSRRHDGPPQNGKQFLGWLNNQPDEIRDHVKSIVRGWGFPTMYREWTDSQAMEVYTEVMRVPAGRQQDWGNGR